MQKIGEFGCLFCLHTWEAGFFWIPMALSGNENKLWLTLGGIMPSVMGIIFTRKPDRKDLWRRLISFKLIHPSGYLIIFLTIPLIHVLTFLSLKITGNATPSLYGMINTLTNPSLLLILVLSELVGGPLAEELGWRGFLLDRLQEKWSAYTSSLILGAIWTVWHLPLFFIIGTSQHRMSSPLGLAGFILQVITLSFLFTWIYNRNNRSILSTLLCHFMVNWCGSLLGQFGHTLPNSYRFITVMFLIIFVTILLICKPMTTTDRKLSSCC